MARPLLTSLGISPKDVITLEVPGRRSGVIRAPGIRRWHGPRAGTSSDRARTSSDTEVLVSRRHRRTERPRKQPSPPLTKEFESSSTLIL